VQAPSLERVVVGVDGSDASFEACRQAAWIAPPEAAFEVVSVVHLADDDKVGWRAPTARDELRLDAEQALETAVATLAAAGRASTPVFVNGFVTDALLRHVEPTSADLLVVGSHGRSGLSRLVLGSVAMACVNHAPCPVVVVRTPHED
jgi:nucleotide-binding universal stress UspA family protein